jgi:Protein phosphatase 2C
MFATLTRLRYWKSEHDETTCEDAYGDDCAQGLFAIADGVGTALYSHIWARILVEYFLAAPLMSDDPFEVEWWLRQAQEHYKAQAPQPAQVSWNAQQKVQHQGSYSTLATLRMLPGSESSPRAELFAIGDSCIFIRSQRTSELFSFPLAPTYDFNQAPVCLPSKLNMFNRHLHSFHTRVVDLAAGDSIILATDTVARWIMSAGHGTFADAKQAFAAVSSQTTATWADFITTCRRRGEMIDDDCSVLRLNLQSQMQSESCTLGSTSTHSPAVRRQRLRDYERELQENNKEQVAILYGDGNDLKLEGLSINQQEIAYARQVADAFKEVITLLRQEVNSPRVVQIMRPIWQKYAPLLENEPCAVNLLQTLKRLGVITTSQPGSDPAPQSQSMQEPEPEIVDSPPMLPEAALPIESNPPASYEPLPFESMSEENDVFVPPDSVLNIPPHIPLSIIESEPSIPIPQELPPEREANAETIDNFTFSRYVQVKKAYRAYKKQASLSDDQLQQKLLWELSTDQYIQEGIAEINSNHKNRVIDPEAQLARELKAFKNGLPIDYIAFLSLHRLAEEEIKDLLLLFLRAELLDNYLRRRAIITLEDWLNLRRRGGGLPLSSPGGQRFSLRNLLKRREGGV